MDQFVGGPAFFDIGDRPASAAISPNGDRIKNLVVYPYVPGFLERLRDGGARLGIISNRGPFPAKRVNEALQSATPLGCTGLASTD